MIHDAPTLDAQNICHHFGKGSARVDVLEDVSLKIESGEFVSIKGASGSGKTTFLLTCGGMQKPQSGSVLIDGDNLYQVAPSSRNQLRARKIGYVFQTLELLPYLNVLENLTLQNKANRNEAVEWLERFGLADRIRHRPDELSHGQRQRVAIIRAIVHQPRLLIADEPTGNLDEDNSKLVFEILRHFSDSGGSVLLASHDSTARQFADHNYILEGHHLTKTTDPDQSSLSTSAAIESSPAISAERTASQSSEPI